MQARAEQLQAHLEARLRSGGLAAIYTVSGDEALLSLEAQDAIRAAARRAGFEEREVVHADGRFDWSELTAAASSQSLFAARRLIEVRLPNGKPGKDGGEALIRHAAAAQAGGDLLTIVSLPRLDRRTREAAWAQALDRAGVWVEVARVERAQLPAWIGQRLERQQQRAGAEATAFIADRVEGNLLAAHQEVLKLGLLYPPGELALQEVARAVLDVARFALFALPQAMLAGDGARVLRTIEGLRAEGEAAPLVSWAITEEIRLLIRLRAELDRGRPFPQLAREQRLWGARLAFGEQGARRLAPARAAQLLARCADIDRVTKGLPVAGAGTDPWLELAGVALAVAGFAG